MNKTLMGLCVTGVVAMIASTLGATPAAAQDPQSGGTLVVANDTEPRNLNPAIVASNGVFFLTSKVVEPLAEMDYETGLKPLLASSWEGSEDGMSFTVHLREGVTWSDGAPFTSADVEFSAMQVWKEKQNIGRSIFANLEAVDTPDDHTAIFRFSKPTPGQLIENAIPAVTAVVPKHLLAEENLDETASTQRRSEPVRSYSASTGPASSTGSCGTRTTGRKTCPISTRSSTGCCPIRVPRPLRWRRETFT